MKHPYTQKLDMKYLFYIFLPLLLLGAGEMFAATDSFTDEELTLAVSGTVISSGTGETLPGVTIQVKGTTQGTVTGFDGEYEIEVEPDAILVFSYIGYATQEIAVNNRTTIDVIMEESAAALDEVVVTALGIKRQEKSLGYSVERIGGDDVQRVAQENVLNALAGKVAGVSISNTGGAGSSVNMVIRGATSLSTDNQPLFVIDGVPMTSGLNNTGGFGEDNRVDYGNAIADLNPDDIEDISILKGPSAAALYGTRAGNGVVLVTTKKAVAGQPMKVSISSNTVFDIPSRFLNTQYQFANGRFSYRPEEGGSKVLPPIDYGERVGAGPENDMGYWAVQWNAPLDANGVPIPTELRSYPNNVRNFLNDYALTTTNTATISNSNPYLNYRLGFTNMTHDGLIPNSDLNRNNLSLAASSNLHDKLTISTNINYTNSFADNRPASNRGTNPLEWAYNQPSNLDIRDLKDYRQGGEVLRPSDKFENPYFLAHEVNNSFDRHRIYGNVAATWNISPSFELMGRYSLNRRDEIRESKIGVGYSNEPNNGSYGIWNSSSMERNIDFLGTYAKDWNMVTLSASAGANFLYSKAASASTSAKPGTGLVVPNVFTVNNIQSGSLNYSNSRNQRAIHSVYGMATVGLGGMAYLDLTARNDWSSTLPAANRSYFYPSASLSVLIDQIVNLGRNMDMLKIRGGVAQVGNDTSPYRLLATYGNSGQWGEAIRLNKSGGLLSPNLLPEEATSTEFGLDLIMFANRLRFEGTVYNVDNRNQIISVPLASSTGFGSIQINSGLLQSKGVELLLGFSPVKNTDWQWDLDFNFTKNDTRVMELADEVDFIEFWSEGRVKNIAYTKSDVLGQDGRVGNLYARKIRRVTDATSPYFGYPHLKDDLSEAEPVMEEDYSLVGNYNPDFILGLQSALRYKNFSLNMTFDWRSGGQYVSQTMRYMSEALMTQTWLDQLVHPGDLGGGPSKELKEWVLANADKLIFSENAHPIGGPTPDYGGFYENVVVPMYDGVFYPGVLGKYDENGKFLVESENLGDEGTAFYPYVLSYPWDIGTANMFDADFIKLREISLNYRFPDRMTEKLRIENLNLSVYSRNIMLWTKDSPLGVDPERAYQPESSGRISQGVERYNVEPWIVPVGIKLSFQF